MQLLQLCREGNTAGSKGDLAGGSNYVCVSDDPQWKNYVNGPTSFSGAIAGVSYGFSSRNSIFNESNIAADLHNYPAPCAVCYVGGRSTILMIPARTQCPYSWTTEYAGYLASEARLAERKRSSYVCWDEASEVAVGRRHQE